MVRARLVGGPSDGGWTKAPPGHERLSEHAVLVPVPSDDELGYVPERYSIYVWSWGLKVYEFREVVKVRTEREALEHMDRVSPRKGK